MYLTPLFHAVMSYHLGIFVCFCAAILPHSHQSAAEHCTVDDCIAPVCDHSLIQRDVRGSTDELRSASQTLHTRFQDQGDAGADLDRLLKEKEDMDKALARKGERRRSTATRKSASHTSTTTTTPDPSFEEGACVTIHWATHNGQIGKISGTNGDKFLNIFLKDQTTEWIPKEYATASDCPAVKKHYCVNVTWVSTHHGQLGKVLMVKRYEGQDVCEVKFEDEQREWIPIAALNYSFKKCPNISIPIEKDNENKSNSSDGGQNSSPTNSSSG
eukprot:TRINITY_DN3549_c1_g1_i1.p1 TRINITY_DN3549_c1_g1~~TRINITY_DN3549_c1_g1_i1.p1  ORF type:complete len:288 (-),score=40.03 TRINITY_DN3549_c1_g1_i1:126-941(-)